MRPLHTLALFCSVLILISTSCDQQKSRPYIRIPQLGTLHGPIMAYCSMDFLDQSNVDIEGQYLPHVVNCENGGAGFEALKSQAVAARSYLYYKLNEYGSIGDSQSDQVYTCGREPGPQHYAAVEATSGEVLTYQDAVIAAFYVAGAIPSPPLCIGVDGDSDQYNTERYVTYNEGRSGDQVEQSTIGWVDPANIYNRGCQSQNGASCLADLGITYRQILSFYYGEDITIERTEGPCILPEELGGHMAGAEMVGAETAGVVMAGAEMTGGELSNPESGTEVYIPNAGQDHISAGEEAANDSNEEEVNSLEQVPLSLSPCKLDSSDELYSIFEMCSWIKCIDQQSHQSLETGVSLICGDDQTCTAGWSFESAVDQHYAFYLNVSDNTVRPDMITYQLSTNDGVQLDNRLSIPEVGEILLGWAQLGPSSKVNIKISNNCGIGQVGIESLRVVVVSSQRVASNSRIGSILHSTPSSSGGASCHSGNPMNVSKLNQTIILLGLISVFGLLRQYVYRVIHFMYSLKS